MKIKSVMIEIDVESETFADAPEREVSRILVALATRLLVAGLRPMKLADFNGNTVGGMSVRGLGLPE
jgi:hypothetical protein